MKRLINWLEIPVNDIDRAKLFYGKIMGITFFDMSLGDVRYAIFPSQDQFNNGALAQGKYYKPSADGVTIYLDGGDDLSKILDAVEQAGGTVITDKMYLSKEAGYIGVFIDTEGNKIGLQNM